MDNGAKLIWKYLLENGDIIGKWNTYTHQFETVPEATRKCTHEINAIGIDFKKTKPVDQDTEYGFIDTFTEGGEPVPVLTGTLVLYDGSKWKWGMPLSQPFDILQLIAHILPDPFEENEE